MRSGVPYRFVLVSAAAFGLDAMIALALRTQAGWPVWLAAAASFLIVAVLAYPLHEYWSFARQGAGRSGRRLARTVAAACASLSARVAVVALLEAAHEPDVALAAVYLLCGALVSLTLNYAISKAWVFRAA